MFAARGRSATGVRALKVVSALGAALFISACIGPDMAEMGDYGAMSPFRADLSAPKPRPVQVFIASTRKGEHGAAAQVLSGDGVHTLRQLTIPPGHRVGLDRRADVGRGQRRERHRASEERNSTATSSGGARLAYLRPRRQQSRRAGVRPRLQHSYDEARERAAQIVADSRFGGVAVLFTWPSQNELFGYVSDKDNATASRDALQSADAGHRRHAGRRQGAGARPFDGRLAGDGGVAPVGDLGRHDLNGKLGDSHARLARHRHGRLRLADGARASGQGDVLRYANDRALSISSAIAQSRQRVGAIDASKPEDRERLEALGAKV